MPTITTWYCDGCAGRLAEMELAPGSFVRVWCERCQGWQSYRQPMPAERLSAREAEVAALVAQGQRNGEIAATLDIGEKTVKTHVSASLRKMGARNRVELARALATGTKERGD